MVPGWEHVQLDSCPPPQLSVLLTGTCTYTRILPGAHDVALASGRDWAHADQIWRNKVQWSSNKDKQQTVGMEKGKDTEKAAQHPQPAGQTPNSTGAQYE
jgi:hypothetical protein